MMGPLLPDALDFLTAQSFASLLALYWYIALFEIPRYGVSFLVAALFRPALLTSARAAAAEALKGLEHHCAAGEIRAGVSGTISAEVPAVGEVFAAATPLLSIHSGQEYVLAYLPSRYLLPINEGMWVRMSDGRLTASGEIVEILTISDTLPDAFRTAFKPGDRRQLARIRLSRPHSFPLFSDIRATQEFRLQRVDDAARAWQRGHRPSPGDDALAVSGQ